MVKCFELALYETVRQELYRGTAIYWL